MRMKLSDFNYELPKELVAEYPNKNRDEARLMVIDRSTLSVYKKTNTKSGQPRQINQPSGIAFSATVTLNKIKIG